MHGYIAWRYGDEAAQFVKGHLSSTGACFDIGNTTVRALHAFERTGQPYCGSPDARSGASC